MNKDIKKVVEELVERYKDPTQLNGTNYLHIPIDKIKHTLTALQEQHEVELEEAFRNGQRHFLKNVRHLEPNRGKRVGYITLDEAGEIDWDKFKTLTPPPLEEDKRIEI